MFIDEARITVHGGDGGNGCLSFRREKFVPRGGPDGGDGGDGGSVFLVADPRVRTLLEFRYRPRYRAERGRHGEGSNRSGRSGDDLEVRVPVGTVVLDADGVRSLADLDEPGRRYLAARGGRGGRGNAVFATSTRQAPTRHDPGEPGEEQELRLELKLLADVGLVGFPNAGKSTLLSRISAAHPKIADYPFTTLEPQLGVVDLGDYRTFVVADLPGLIEGAHLGAGLGLRFLRHIERCRLLLHLVDATDPERDPVEGMRTIEAELRTYDPALAEKPVVVVVTKADARPDPERVARVRERAQASGRDCHVISAVSGEGLRPLLLDVGARLDDGRAATPERASPAEPGTATVGVLGGTFDPVHRGHVALAEEMLRRLGLARVLLVPAAIPPHKPPDGLTPSVHREAMLRLAATGRPGLEVSTIELETGRACYTIDTMRELRRRLAPARPVFLLGLDGVVDLPTWRDYRDLMHEFDLVVVDRPGSQLAERRAEIAPEVGRRIVELGDAEDAGAAVADLGGGGRILHVTVPTVAASSSEIRRRLARGESIADLVPAPVDRYIRDNRLYRGEPDRGEDDR